MKTETTYYLTLRVAIGPEDGVKNSDEAKTFANELVQQWLVRDAMNWEVETQTTPKSPLSEEVIRKISQEQNKRREQYRKQCQQKNK